MEFWGAEVKVGETVKVDPFELDAIVHLSQVALGEAKKDKPNESVVVSVKVGEQKVVLGTLSRDKIPQFSLDIVFENEFELSHNSKTASVHFCGYKSLYSGEDYSSDEGEEESESEDEDIPLTTTLENGKPEPKAEDVKVSEPKKADAKNAAPAKKAAPVKQVKVVDPKEDEDEDSDDDESDESGDELGSSDAEMENADSEDEDDESDEDDEEETPVKKVDQGKKRPNESASKTPVSSKKSKNATPEKTDGKKAGHTATPHPKKGGKTPNSDAKEAKTPKSGGLSCNSCSKTFNSETGLQQHSKAKHAAK